MKQDFIKVKTGVKAGGEFWTIDEIPGKGRRITNNQTGEMITARGGGQVAVEQAPPREFYL